jgi:hypothetical protein
VLAARVANDGNVVPQPATGQTGTWMNPGDTSDARRNDTDGRCDDEA